MKSWWLVTTAVSHAEAIFCWTDRALPGASPLEKIIFSAARSRETSVLHPSFNFGRRQAVAVPGDEVHVILQAREHHVKPAAGIPGLVVAVKHRREVCYRAVKVPADGAEHVRRYAVR